jgi:predicted metal-dependent hydrolase
LVVDAKGYARGIELFNRQHFYDAHEIWEDVWRETRGPEKKFLQGLIQAAVALHHHSTGNIVGACSLLERSRKNLAGYPEEFGGIRLTALIVSLAEWRESLLSGRPNPAFPKVDRIE